MQEDSEPHGARRAAAAGRGEVSGGEKVLGKVEDKSGDVAAVSVTAERDRRRDMVRLQFSLALDLILLNSLTDFVSFLKGHF